jgi:hypothetical protein
MKTASEGGFRQTRDPNRLQFLEKTRFEAFAFQAKVRKELMAADPERLKDLPDGSVLFRRGFPVTSRSGKVSTQRPLPIAVSESTTLKGRGTE